MIPVVQQNEPDNFDRCVRQPGKNFLQNNIPQKSTDWKGKEFWQKALPDLRTLYAQKCSYCSHWIPHSTGGHSIDHFQSKSQYPHLAYEWSNFRYVSKRFNSRKGIRVILDPFNIEDGWFILDFSCFFIKPNPDLNLNQQTEIDKTIQILKLNDDEDLIDERQTYIVEYSNNDISFEHLQNRAPFLAYELDRQGLVESIRQRRLYPSLNPND